MQWEVVLSVDQESRVEAVTHQGELLETVNGECSLSSFSGRLSIEFADHQPTEVSLFEGDPLVFKTNRSWRGDGRRVRRVTNGYFILIAPTAWPREGHVPVEPAGCADLAFTAHYFFRDSSETVDAIGGFSGHPVGLGASGFELVGNSVFDDSEEGDLFVGVPPQLEPADDVVWARVGEEMRNGWAGENFKPAEKTLDEVLNGRQGRFFVRVYAEDEAALLDSGQFRYLHSLHEILVNEEPYTQDVLLVPPSSGHPPTMVRFIGAGGALIRPNLWSGKAYVEERDGCLLVEPHPDADTLDYELDADGGRVGIVLNLPRVWWQLALDRTERGAEWRDTPFEMTRHKFREHANANGALRLRLPRRVRSVLVGFDDEVNRLYQTTENDVVLPLGDFLDYRQIDHLLTNAALLNVQLGYETLALIRIPADPAPMIVSFTCESATAIVGETLVLSWTTRHAEDVSVEIAPGIGAVEPTGSLEIAALETMTWVLRLTAAGMDDITSRVSVRVCPAAGSVGELVAEVRGAGGGWRRGRGFSRGELRDCGLTATEAARRSIPTDRRRRSTHPTNIEALGGSTDG